MRGVVLAAGLMTAFSLPLSATEPRKADFLQDYITCEQWMNDQDTGSGMHVAIGRWLVDSLRQHSPSRLPHLADDFIIETVERFCVAQPAISLGSAAFLAGLRLPEQRH